MQSEIVRQPHENNGHFGVLKVEEIIKRQYYFENMKEKIASHIKNCVVCILTERKQGRQEGYLHPIAKDDEPLSTIYT